MPQPPQPELMPLLLEAREREGRLDGETVERIARILRIPASRVYGFLTQFPELTRFPSRQPLVRVCTGPACAARDARYLLDGLREGLRGVAEVACDPGLVQPHRSPALVIQMPGGEERMLQGVTPHDLEDIARSVRRRDLSAFPATPEDASFPVSRYREEEPPPWLSSLQGGALPALFGGEVLQRVAQDPAAVLRLLEDAWPGLREMATGDVRAPAALVCDAVGGSPENSPDLALARSHPRAVVAGAALAAAAMGTGSLVFYVPWDRAEVAGRLRAAAEEMLPALEIGYRVFKGPVHIPCSRDIGVASVLQGVMLWRAASLCGRDGAGRLEPAMAVLAAASLWRLPWLLEGAAGKGEGHDRETLLVSVPGELPRWMELPRRLRAAEARGLLREKEDGGEPRAVFAEGVAGGALLCGEEFAIPRGARKVTVLTDATRMARWAVHLLEGLEEGCCGGCSPGRTAPAAAARMVRSMIGGEQGKRDAGELAAMLREAEELALCPRLGEVFPALITCLEDFPEDFRLPEEGGVRAAAKAGGKTV